jgi:ATP-binding cassette subfamily F protein 3
VKVEVKPAPKEVKVEEKSSTIVSKEQKNIQNKLKKVEEKISELESEIETLEASFTKENPSEETLEKYNKTKEELEVALQEWEHLGSQLV